MLLTTGYVTSIFFFFKLEILSGKLQKLQSQSFLLFQRKILFAETTRPQPNPAQCQQKSKTIQSTQGGYIYLALIKIKILNEFNTLTIAIEYS